MAYTGFPPTTKSDGIRDMLEQHGASLPHGWIAGDDEMGRPYWFRRRLDHLGERSLLAVPGNTLMRDLEAVLPTYSGRGGRPAGPGESHRPGGPPPPPEAPSTLDLREWP